MAPEPLDVGDEEGVPTELVELYEVLEWENAVAAAEHRGLRRLLPRRLPHPEIGLPPPNDPGVEGSTPFVSRAGWGGRTPTCWPTNFRLEGLTIHYAGPSPWTGVDRSSAARFQATASHSRCPTIWRSMEAYHMNQRGGCCIFYHGAACPHGVRFEGRPKSMRSGAQGTNDGNYRSFGVQTLTGLNDPLTNASKIAFLDFQTYFGKPFRWGHRDWKSTSCPGTPAYDWRRAGFPRPGGTPPPPPPPATWPPQFPGTVRLFDSAGRRLDPLMRGAIPLAWQRGLLGWAKISLGSDGADGVWGPASHNALVTFQRRVGVDDDGIGGPVTWGKLAPLAPKPTPPPIPGPDTTEEKMLYLVKLDDRPHVWVTDWLTKRHMWNQTDSNVVIWFSTLAGQPISTLKGADGKPTGKPHVLSDLHQKINFDRIPVVGVASSPSAPHT